MDSTSKSCVQRYNPSWLLKGTFSTLKNIEWCISELNNFVSLRSGHEGIVERLITANADVNVTNEDGSSALHLSCIKGSGIKSEFIFNTARDLGKINSPKSYLSRKVDRIFTTSKKLAKGEALVPKKYFMMSQKW